MSGNRIEVTCTVDIEKTADSLHAHAIPEGIDIRPGDSVLVHDAPWQIGYGERVTKECRATVIRANVFGRMWAQIEGLMEMLELFEVGFAPKEQS
jgi:hypothetical protein